MTYYHLRVNLQAMYDDETFKTSDGLEEMEKIKKSFPTLEIVCDELEQEDELTEAGFWVHDLEAENPMDIVRFLIYTNDLNDKGLWEAIQEIEPNHL